MQSHLNPYIQMLPAAAATDEHGTAKTVTRRGASRDPPAAVTMSNPRVSGVKRKTASSTAASTTVSSHGIAAGHVVLPEDSGIIRCVCSFDTDDGFTVQCDRCYAWLHGSCVGFTPEEEEMGTLPDTYVCPLCLNGGKVDSGVRARANRVQKQRMQALAALAASDAARAALAAGDQREIALSGALEAGSRGAALAANNISNLPGTDLSNIDPTGTLVIPLPGHSQTSLDPALSLYPPSSFSSRGSRGAATTTIPNYTSIGAPLSAFAAGPATSRPSRRSKGNNSISGSVSASITVKKGGRNSLSPGTAAQPQQFLPGLATWSTAPDEQAGFAAHSGAGNGRGRASFSPQLPINEQSRGKRQTSSAAPAVSAVRAGSKSKSPMPAYVQGTREGSYTEQSQGMLTEKVSSSQKSLQIGICNQG